MIIFILNTIFKVITLTYYSILSQDKLFFKCVLIVVLLLLLKLYTIYPKMLSDDPFEIANYYKISNVYNKLFTFFVLFTYFLIFICGIFFLRLANQQKFLDLKVIWNNLYADLISHTISHNIINIILFALIILTYFYTIIKLLAFFRKHWVKLHIYYAVHEDNWYGDYLLAKIIPRIQYLHLLMNIRLKFDVIDDISRKMVSGLSIYNHIVILINCIHYILLFIVFIYDIVFCNFTLNTIYKILPYLFIYDIYIRFCNLYNSLDCMYMADYTAHAFIYAETIKVINSEETFIDGDFYSTRSVANAICVYLRTGLNSKILCMAYGDEYPFYEKTYYKAWKNLKAEKSSKTI